MTRPADCTMRLRDEGRAAPRSGCRVSGCKTGGMTGCPYDRVTAPAQKDGPGAGAAGALTEELTLFAEMIADMNNADPTGPQEDVLACVIRYAAARAAYAPDQGGSGAGELRATLLALCAEKRAEADRHPIGSVAGARLRGERDAYAEAARLAAHHPDAGAVEGAGLTTEEQASLDDLNDRLFEMDITTAQREREVEAARSRMLAALPDDGGVQGAGS